MKTFYWLESFCFGRRKLSSTIALKLKKKQAKIGIFPFFSTPGLLGYDWLIIQIIQLKRMS